VVHCRSRIPHRPRFLRQRGPQTYHEGLAAPNQIRSFDRPPLGQERASLLNVEGKTLLMSRGTCGEVEPQVGREVQHNDPRTAIANGIGPTSPSCGILTVPLGKKHQISDEGARSRKNCRRPVASDPPLKVDICELEESGNSLLRSVTRPATHTQQAASQNRTTTQNGYPWTIGELGQSVHHPDVRSNRIKHPKRADTRNQASAY
jgi:hypothetical protein